MREMILSELSSGECRTSLEASPTTFLVSW
jgi:hypothetical protein